MILITPWLFRMLPGGKYRAMAIWPFILLRSADLKASSSLINHEKIHWRQQLEYLVVLFYPVYLAEYAIGRIRGLSHQTAYRMISFEQEAYDKDSDPAYLKNRKPYAHLRYLRKKPGPSH